MWQLTFKMSSEDDAREMRNRSKQKLKAEALALARTAKWHSEFVRIIEDSEESEMRGGSMYDRVPERCQDVPEGSHVVIIGDAAHPMSPFKGRYIDRQVVVALWNA